MDNWTEHMDNYEKEEAFVKRNWTIIKEKYENGQEIGDDIWSSIFKRPTGNFGDGSRNVRNTLIGKVEMYDEDNIDKVAVLFFETIEKLIGERDIEKQKQIISKYVNNDFSKGIRGAGRFSPVLYYLDDYYFAINNKTIMAVKLLSNILGNEIVLTLNLENYIEVNETYKKFLNDLGNACTFDNFKLNDFRVFDQLCHWLCDAGLGYYCANNKNKNSVNMLPFELISDGKMAEVDNMKRNIIYFGAPGTGKSYTLNKDKISLIDDDENYERVTFHPDYSYANFVGTYKPVPKDGGISYEYVPGPFSRLLKKAISNPDKIYLLIIEEINRANISAVFGDVFQLLDRNSNMESRYPINISEEMKTYLKRDKVKIPSNMFIWATMNSADQGVFPMDTAFKRRWDFKYFGIDDNDERIANIKVQMNNQLISWNELRKAINDELLSYKINEDKLIGPFFAFTEYLNTEISTDEFREIFKNKIIMYLFEDVAKARRNELFNGVYDGKNLTYSKICDEFDKIGINIFCENIREKFDENDADSLH